jgi:hypothetical protein|tara:strand:+ start:4300 stop:5070 length:771 start_codon:yes stop_codon:yes gene_type:complete
MNLFNLIKNTRNKPKKINIKNLPSRGFFYKDGFEIYITKCNKDYIKQYKKNIDTTNIPKILKRITRLIIDHTSYSEGYSYKNIISVDLLFIFLEIVKHTKGESIFLDHYDEETKKIVKIKLDEKTFDYYEPNEEFMNSYDIKEKCFKLNGYMISSPTTGAEEDLTQFLNSISSIPGSEKFNNYNYNFLYVLGNKTSIGIPELKNLIQIFSEDMTKEERINLQEAISNIMPIQKYKMLYNGKSIPVSSKLDLSVIFD